MAKIEKIGRLYPLDEEGFIVNPTDRKNLREPWARPVSFLLEESLSAFGKDLHSLYIRGSIAAGTAVEGVSDMDAILVLRDFAPSPLPRWVEALEAEIQQSYDFLRGVEVVCVPRSRAVSPARSRLVIQLKTQSLCIYGTDLTQTLAPYRPGPAAMLEAPRLRPSIGFVLAKLKKEIEPLETTAYCRWVMKIIVRSAFELVQERERLSTRDLYFCAECFLKYYAEKSSEVWTAVEWAVNPISERAPLTHYLQTFGLWLCQEVELSTLRMKSRLIASLVE